MEGSKIYILLNIVLLQEIRTTDIEFDKYNYLRIISSKMQEALELPLQGDKTTRFTVPDQVQVKDLVLGTNTSIKGDTIIIQPLVRRKKKRNTKAYI
jgi:tRNA U34 5-carboxymethylaminomethyl modifying enzyme MnmG/GidA